MLIAYPDIAKVYVDADQYPDIAASYNIFTVPGILLYVQGKEFIREARHISMIGLEESISRYYNLLYRN